MPHFESTHGMMESMQGGATDTDHRRKEHQIPAENALEGNYEQIELDHRKLEVIETSRYFDLYKEDLRTLFSALGRDDEWSDDPREMLEYVESRWIGKEHGNSTEKDQFTDKEIATALPILRRLGLLGELLPPDGSHYDQILAPGATLPVIDRRLGLVKKLLEEHNITTDMVVLLAGERPLNSNEQIQERYPGTDFSRGKWVQARERFAGELAESQSQLFQTETDAGRAAVIGGWIKDGAAEPHQTFVNLANITGMTADEAARVIKPPLDRVEYEVPVTQAEGQAYRQKIRVLNAAPVPRPQGDPRPTSASQMQEYVEREAPIRRPVESLDINSSTSNQHDAPIRILYVSSNPHTLRMACDAYRELQRLGRGDIHMDVAGVRENPEMPIQTALGELGRLIANDVRRNYPPLALPELMAA